MPRARRPPSPPARARGLFLPLAAAIAAAASCTSATSTNVPVGPPSSPDGPPAAAAAKDGSTPASPPPSAGAGDASADAGPLTLTVFPRVGDATDDAADPAGPGLIVMGGGPDVDDAFVWAEGVVAGGRAGRAGDAVVLRATGTDAYTSYLYGLAPFHSVQTVLVPPGATAADLAAAAAIVSHAELVFFAGGDQSHYVAWKGTPLMAAVQGVYDRGGVVGGTSAGAAILGAFAYDAVKAGATNLTSAVALSDPLAANVTFTRHMLALSPLAHVVTDPHFEQRDRLGRLVAFVARQFTDGAVTTPPPFVYGVGVDEGGALVVDAKGVARLKTQSSGARAFVVKGGPVTATPGAPLVYPGLTVYRFDDPLDAFDFGKGCGDLRSYALAVDGAAASPFTPSSPYDAPGTTEACP